MIKKINIILILVCIFNLQAMERIPIKNKEGYIALLKTQGKDQDNIFYTFKLSIPKVDKFSGECECRKNIATNIGWIYNLNVDKKYQKKGYGSALFQAAIKQLINDGCESISWIARSTEKFKTREEEIAVHKRLFSFYEKNGAIVTDKISDACWIMEYNKNS